jgi:RND family efflux transporter MFP subunit
MKHFRWLIPLVIITVSAAGYLFLRTKPGALPGWFDGALEIVVTVEPVQRISVPMTARVTGELSPARQAVIVSRLAGKVTTVGFAVGDSVRAGAVVASIHSGALAQRATELQAAVHAAQQDLKQKEDLVAGAEERLAKSRELHRQDLIARRDVTQAEMVMDTARAQSELARANLAQQEAMLAQVRSLQDLTRLSAPIDGVVTERWVEPGGTIAESGPILTIADLRSLKIIAKVSGVHSDRIRNGMKVEISSLESSGAISQGIVVGARPLIKTTGEEISQVEIHVDNPKGIFRPGITATAVIFLEQQEDVLLLPRAAVVAAHGRHYVYGIVGNRAVRREIAVGNERGGQIEIKNGLKEGDSVIVDQLNLVKAGSHVRVLAAQAPAGRE